MNVRIAAACVLLVFLAGTHWKAYVAGRNTIIAAWDAEKAEAEKQAETNRLLRQVRVNDISRKYVEKTAENRHVTQSNFAKVEEYAPASFPPLPGSFRVWHDAAAAGETLDDTGRVDAAPVPLKQTAATVAGNYADANYDKQRLEALQAIVRASGCFDLEE
jgi:hypothetical protein